MGNFDLEYVSVPGKNRILGLAFPMRTDGVGGFLTSNENLGSLRDCVIQLIMTRRGARVMRPDFGTDVRQAVFEPLDSRLVDTLKSQISSTIAKYEPRVIIKNLTITPNWEENRLTIKLSLSSKDDLLNTEFVELLV
tara:strand:- start:87 stop:497 length:411 start_codon:yes stop_codon:yes gene_type:complete